MTTETGNNIHQESGQPRVVWIAVNYFNDHDSLKFISGQYLKQDTSDCIFILVNNGSTDYSLLGKKLKDFSGVVLLDARQNLGYFGALNFALDYIKTKFKSYPEKVVFSNTDISLNSDDFLKNICSINMANNIACIGPSIFKDGMRVNQNPFYTNRINRKKLLLLRFIFSNYAAYLFYQYCAYVKQRFVVQKQISKEAREVYALHGSFLIFNHVFLSKCDSILKQAPFLFGEEIFLAEICLRKKFILFYNPELIVFHHEHSVTGKYKSRKTVSYLYQSVEFLLTKYFNKNN